MDRHRLCTGGDPYGDAHDKDWKVQAGELRLACAWILPRARPVARGTGSGQMGKPVIDWQGRPYDPANGPASR